MRKQTMRFVIPAILALFLVMPVASADVEDDCMSCHKENTAGIYHQWANSEHGKNDVTCLNCHEAEKGDVDAFKHEGALIATLVTPKDCGECHADQAEEVQNSYHATAGLILESKDAYLAHVAGGHPAAITGCESCHGTKVKIDHSSPNKLSMQSWPNSGVGRLNPDGSKGSCTACHMRHSFSKEQVRQPEVCGKCHLGPDHPQKEIYEESKHGIAYYGNIDKMNLDSDKWVVGEDYSEAPTCATCHISASKTQPVNHDVGSRISWTLRPPVSKMKDNWEEKRGNMKEVCSACHSPAFVDGHYYQFDGLVNLYNEKFAKPAGKIIKILKKNHAMEHQAAFSNEVEWAYWELWHHEGRRARHGASMMGPDYTWWHGIYEVAHNFYFELIPAALELDDKEATAYIEKLLKDDPMHSWMNRPTKELKEEIRSGKMKEIYKDLFQTVQDPKAVGGGH
ncbi:hypothetical protein CEE37_13525 [candidate division LCP-89 bacterium B3_LCP]|uniref:Cytochrome c-552/4 domain-containing protein n=1 Tax=candidate division LCP-89 bacterium B3_LCP TaxID=2012998 RepID=A0A532UT36_UNCL8|nr:MAG: hypothetical protein CEE37_13525 [candidate division LCP-89 bacterium B3_LCP]